MWTKGGFSMSDTINVIDWDQIVSDEKVIEKLQVEPFYQLRVGNQHYNVRRLSAPDTFQISKPDNSNIDNSQVRAFIDLYFDECLRYLENGDSKGLVNFYEYTSQLNDDKTAVTVRAFKSEAFHNKNQGFINLKK